MYYKLSRFGCYLIAKNVDSKKFEIAKAQAYFDSMTRFFELMMEIYKFVTRRGVDRTKPIDHMGRAELAANSFRITMTEEIIKNEKVKGQTALKRAHNSVGKQVRQMLRENTGKNPEDLPVEKRLSDVKKEIKAGYKQINKQDK